MVGIIEQMRQDHEDMENLEQAAVGCLFSKAKKELGVPIDFCIDFVVDEIQRKSTQLLGDYDDPDAFRSDEIRCMGGDGPHDVWHVFYTRVAEVKESSTRELDTNTTFPQSSVDTWKTSAISSSKARMEEFTGEECNGRYVDLTRDHQSFLNLRKLQDYFLKQFVQGQWTKFLKIHSDMDPNDAGQVYKEFCANKSSAYRPLDYVSWLRQFGDFESIPRYFKYRQNDYLNYIESLSSYLQGFVKKQRPLLDIDSKLHNFKSEFVTIWLDRGVPGWKELTHEMAMYSLPTDKLFTNERALSGHLTSKEYIKASARLLEGDLELFKSKSIEIDRIIAEHEALISYLRNILLETIEDTIDHVTRKQARTSFEIERDLAAIYGSTLSEEPIEDDNASIASSSGGEEMDMNDRAIYNPLNLPLGWDGKPIPYWMYKLHGLGHEFKCEICGNFSYWGRRAFEIHFNEWKHVNGLKSLRIPNSSHFYGITGIEDAIRINTKLRKETTSAIFNADKEMECEDALGNVMSYRAYQDLVRQGLA